MARRQYDFSPSAARPKPGDEPRGLFAQLACLWEVTARKAGNVHPGRDFANLRYGVGTAQRGWLTPDDVVNTWPLDRLRDYLGTG